MIFNAGEILQIAVDIEQQGQAFYRKAATCFKPGETQKLLLSLADWEARHEITFSEIRDKLAAGLAEADFDSDGVAARYLQAIAEGKIFKAAEPVEQVFQAAKEPAAILQIALQREKDSVIFYQAMRELVPPELGREQVEHIIGEEMDHVIFLSEKISELAAK
jgi:rubrerythrin